MDPSEPSAVPTGLSLLEEAGVIVYRYHFGPQLCVDYVSPQVGELIGIEAEQFYQAPLSVGDGIHPDDREMVLTAMKDPANYRYPFTVRWTSPHARFRQTEHHRVPLGREGGPQAFLGLAFDITPHADAGGVSTAVDAPAMRAMWERIEQARETERTRIARELHDELGQLLLGIKLEFAGTMKRILALDPSREIIDRLQSAGGQIDVAVTMVKRIARDLRPPVLDYQGLGEAVTDEAHRVSTLSGVPIEVRSELSLPVPTPVATVAFRVFQEALTNTIRHASASSIAVTVSADHRRLRLTVGDDGVGLPPAARRPGPHALGLLGMSERAQSVGGRLRLRSRAGRGTLVVLTLPLAARTP